MARNGPGASKGCNTCRRRHIKCDERRPTCHRCEKANYFCEGYARERRFVDETTRTERQVTKAAKVTKPLWTRQSETRFPEAKDADVSKMSLSLCCGFDISGPDDNIHVSFLLWHLFGGKNLRIPWLRHHAGDMTSLSAHASVRALAAIYFGRVHHRPDITNRARELYGTALTNLNHDLQDQDKAWSTSLLKTAMTLEFYEFFAFNSLDGWMKHADGVGKLLEIRGPWRHQLPSDRRLLEGNRVTIALKCLVQRKRCFLEHPNWKVIPWALDPESKTPTIYLHEILCDIPGLMEDASDLHHRTRTPWERTEKHMSLCENILLHLQTLYEWRSAWAFRNPNACYSVPATRSDGSEQLFPTVLYYTELGLANDISIYNAILLLLLRLGVQIIGPNFDASIPALHLQPSSSCIHDPLIPPGTAQNQEAIATEICRSVEYHLCCEESGAAAFMLMFPLRVAWLAFPAESIEALWSQTMMNKIADLSGFEISRGLSGRGVVEGE